MESVCLLQVEVKGRVNLDKLTAFLEELRVSKSRTVSLGTLMSAHGASAADKTHLVEVRHGCAASKQDTARTCSFFDSLWRLLLGNQWSHADACIACLHDRCLFVVCPCFACAMLCLYCLMLSPHCMSGMVCFSSSNATADDIFLTTHILARLRHSSAAVIVRSPCMLYTAQLAGSESFWVQRLASPIQTKIRSKQDLQRV